MCDPFSLVSAGSSFLGGITESANQRAQADYQAGMIKVGTILATADARDAETGLRRDFEEMARKNIASMAITGLDPESFSAVLKGNRENLRENIEAINTNLNSQKSAARAEAAMAKIQGKINSRAAFLSGAMTAVGTLKKADMMYEDNRLKDESRMDYFKRSMG